MVNTYARRLSNTQAAQTNAYRVRVCLCSGLLFGQVNLGNVQSTQRPWLADGDRCAGIQGIHLGKPFKMGSLLKGGLCRINLRL